MEQRYRVMMGVAFGAVISMPGLAQDVIMLKAPYPEIRAEGCRSGRILQSRTPPCRCTIALFMQRCCKGSR